MSIFLDKCKALLDRLFKINVGQSKACSNLFYLLIFDTSLRAVSPPKIIDDFRKMLQRISNGEMNPCRDFLSILRKSTLFLVILLVSLITVMHSTMTHWYIDEQIRTAQGRDVLPVEPGKCVITIHLKQTMRISSQLQVIKFAPQDYFL